MTDDLIRASLRRALHLEPNPGLTDRMTEYANRAAGGEVELPPRRITLRTVAATVVLAGAFAAGGLFVLQHRTASRLTQPPTGLASPPAGVVGSPSPPSATSAATPAATASASALASGSPGSSPTPTPTPYPDCQAADLKASLNSAGTYAAGSSVPIQETVTNQSGHGCVLPPWCWYGWTVTDAQGHMVAASPRSADCGVSSSAGAGGNTLQPGQTAASYTDRWSTTGIAAGTYTVSATLGSVSTVSVQVTIVGPPPTNTPAASPTPTPTPLIP